MALQQASISDINELKQIYSGSYSQNFCRHRSENSHEQYLENKLDG